MSEHIRGTVTHIESINHYRHILLNNPDKLVVCDFFATWCGPCQMIAPQIESMAEMFRNVIFIKVDVDELKDVAMMNQVRAMPTFMFFKNGAKIAQFEGADSSRLQSMVLQYDTYQNELVKNAKEALDQKGPLTQNEEALKTLISILNNIANHPMEEKYRSIRTTNPAIEKRLGSVPGALAFLQGIGFERNGEFLTLAKDKNVTEQYVDILDMVKKQHNLTSQMARMRQKDLEDQEKKRLEIEARMAQIKEEKRNQLKEKQRLATLAKLDHRDQNSH